MKYYLILLLLVFTMSYCKNKSIRLEPAIEITMSSYFLGKDKGKIVPSIKEYYFNPNTPYYIINIKNKYDKNILVKCRQGGNLISFEKISTFKLLSDTLESLKVSIGDDLNDFEKLIKINDSVNFVAHVESPKEVTHLKLPFRFLIDTTRVIDTIVLIDIRNIPQLR